MPLRGATAAVDAALGGAIGRLIRAGEATGKWGEETLIHSLGRLPVERVLVMGLGKAEELTLDRVRAVAAEAARAPAPDDTCYLFTYFTKNGEDGLHLAWSRDGYKWEALNGGQSYLAPQVGKEKLVRDPCAVRGPDGRAVTLFDRLLRPATEAKDRGMQSFDVPLPSGGGRVILEITPGPKGDISFDWTYWSRVKFE